MRALIDPVHGHDFAIVHIAAVEIAAAMHRRVRAGSLTASDVARAVAEMQHHVFTRFFVISVTAALISESIAVAARHGLRGYDCIQLAGLLSFASTRTAAALSPPTLVSADRELNAAAADESIAVEDPNSHP